VNIATAAIAAPVNIANNTTAGTVNIGTGSATQTLNIGTGSGVKTVSFGSTNTTSTTTINGGTGGVQIAGGTTSTPVNIATGSNDALIQIGTAASSGRQIIIGNTTGNSSTTVGGLKIGLGTATQAYVTASVNLTNYGLALTPNGTGSFSTCAPDGTTTGGNARGQYAVDLQLSRAAASQVAGGNYSTIGGGDSNIASSVYAMIGGGYSNNSSGQYAAIAGGRQNTASGLYSSIAGGYLGQAAGQYSFVGSGDSSYANANYSSIGSGYQNQITPGATAAGIFSGVFNRIAASGTYSFIGGGGNNTLATRNEISGSSSGIVNGHTNVISGNQSFIGAGNTNTITADSGVIGGGQSNTVSASYSSIPGGYQSYTRYYGEVAHSSGRFANDGDAQSSFLTLRRSITVAAGSTELTLDGGSATSSNVLVLTNNSAFQYDIRVIVRDTGTTGQYAWFTRSGGIYRDTTVASTAIIGTNVTNTGTTGGDAASWTCTVQAENSTNGALQILVNAPQGTGPIYAVASIKLIRVG
jgi:hypothetical protein